MIIRVFLILVFTHGRCRRTLPGEGILYCRSRYPATVCSRHIYEIIWARAFENTKNPDAVLPDKKFRGAEFGHGVLGGLLFGI